MDNAEIARLSGPDREVLKAFFDLMRDEEIWADAETAALRRVFARKRHRGCEGQQTAAGDQPRHGMGRGEHGLDSLS